MLLVTTDPQYTKQTQTQASEATQLPDPPKLEDIPALCNKVIATIMNKVNRKLVHSLTKRNRLYKTSPKRYHNNLKTEVALQPNAKDQPKLDAIRDPTTNEITTHHTQIINILHTHLKKEQSCNTPDTPRPPGQNPLNPDPYTNPKPNTPPP